MRKQRTAQALLGAGILISGLSGTLAAAAEAYPSRPIRVIVPSAPGSGPDIIARLVGGKLTDALGEQVVVDNRSGGAGAIGSEIAANAAPDGYTFLLATSQTLTATLIFERPSYDLIRNYSPVSLIAATQFVLVANPSLGATSIKELIALAKAKPGALHYGSSGAGGALHVVAEMFKATSGINLVHVPYKSVVYAMVDVMGGQIQLAFSVIPAALPLIKQGKLRPLGVTSRKRSLLLPGVQTIDETVPGFESIGWYGLVAPLKTPAAIIGRVNTVIVKALKSEDLKARMQALALDPIGTTPKEFRSFLATEAEKLGKVIKAAGIRPK